VQARVPSTRDLQDRSTGPGTVDNTPVGYSFPDGRQPVITLRSYRSAVSFGPAAQAAAAAARMVNTGERVRIVVPDGNLLSSGEPAVD
jgi:hypothetical protein